MSWQVLQLGYGMQGKASLVDILKNKNVQRVTVCDQSDEILNLNKKLKDERICSVQIDIKDEVRILQLMRDADVIIEFMPGTYSFYIAKLAVEAGTSLVTSMYLFDPGEQDSLKLEQQKKSY